MPFAKMPEKGEGPKRRRLRGKACGKRPDRCKVAERQLKKNIGQQKMAADHRKSGRKGWERTRAQANSPRTRKKVPARMQCNLNRKHLPRGGGGEVAANDRGERIRLSQRESCQRGIFAVTSAHHKNSRKTAIEGRKNPVLTASAGRERNKPTSALENPGRHQESARVGDYHELQHSSVKTWGRKIQKPLSSRQ